MNHTYRPLFFFFGIFKVSKQTFVLFFRMKHLERLRVVVWLLIEIFVVSAVDQKTLNEVDPLHNISKTDERIHRYKRSGVESQDCAASIRDHGLSLINFGIEKLAPSISP